MQNNNTRKKAIVSLLDSLQKLLTEEDLNWIGELSQARQASKTSSPKRKNRANKTMFDFEDGHGPVPAHNHSNGGGWVANSAKVAPTAYVGPDARVYGNARVSGDAQVFDNAKVHGNARVSDDAQVYGNAQVHGNARVSDDAQVYDEAQVYGNARVSGDARVYDDTWVKNGRHN